MDQKLKINNQPLRSLSIQSLGNDDDIEQFLQEIKMNQLDTQKEFTDAMIEKEKQLFYEIKQTLEEPDPIDFNDRIFSKLCTEEELKLIAQSQPNQCVKCQKKFNLLSKKYQCFFCGNLVCQIHGRKQRENPQIKDNFQRICDICEDKYLKRMINMEFKKKKDKIKKMTKILEEKQEKILQEKNARQKQLEDLKQKSQNEGGIYTQEQMKYGAKINRIKQQIKTLEADHSQIKEKINIIDGQIIDYLKQEENRKKLISQKKEEEKELTNKIIAVEYDIKDLQYIIDEVQKRINESAKNRVLEVGEGVGNIETVENSQKEDDNQILENPDTKIDENIINNQVDEKKSQKNCEIF